MPNIIIINSFTTRIKYNLSTKENKLQMQIAFSKKVDLLNFICLSAGGLIFHMSGKYLSFYRRLDNIQYNLFLFT